MIESVGIVDLGAGNVNAVCNRISELGKEYCLIDGPTSKEISHIILPGVGNFDAFMGKMRDKGLPDFLTSQFHKGVNIMGICVGMHALAYESEEGSCEGLGLIPGLVKKIKVDLPKPHMGWNSIHIENDDPIVSGVDLNMGFYYLHNYRFLCESDSKTIAYSNYGDSIAGIVRKDNIFGVQFHPEKSHKNGLLLFKNFLELQC